MVRRRDESKAEAILEAALTEVAQVGLSGLSIDAVAKRGRVAAGTIYVYFSSKDALIEALYAKVKLGFSGLVFSSEILPVRPGIEAICRRYLQYCRSHPRELIFLDQIEASPTWRDKVGSTTTMAMRPLVKLLEQGKAERIVRDIESQTLIAYLAGGLQASARLSMEDGSARSEQRTSQIISLCWSVLAA